MKTALVFSFLWLAAWTFSQPLAEFYKKDVIQLQSADDFAINNNWNELFNDFAASAHGKPLGQMKKIVVAPDGSVFMSHKTKYEIWKFDSKGDFVKKFGTKGGKPGQFIYLPSVDGVLDGKYLITSDVQGRLNCFDLNGNFIKMLKLDYMPLAITPLKNGKIAILGFVAWKQMQSKNILRIKDFNTGEEKEIWQEITGSMDRMITVKFPGGGMMGSSIPYTHPMLLRFRLAASLNGTLIVASPATGEVKEFSSDGQLLNTFNLNITPVKITDEDIQEQYQQAVEDANGFEQRIINTEKWTDAEKREMMDSYRSQLGKFKDRSNYPAYLPYFSTMVVDSDGNLIVFQFTRDEDQTSNKFNVYSYDLKGNLIGSSSFNSSKYELSYTPASFQFHNGFVYAVAVGLGEQNGPPRLVKMKMM